MIQRWVVARVLTAKGIRAFGDGFVSLLLPLYLLDLGFSPLQVGIIATATLLGSGLLTLAVGLHAHGGRYRTLLLAGAVLMVGTGLGFAFAIDFWPLFVIAIVGTLNPSSGDVSVFLPLEHAVLSHVVGTRTGPTSSPGTVWSAPSPLAWAPWLPRCPKRLRALRGCQPGHRYK